MISRLSTPGEFAVRHPGTPYGLFWFGGIDVGSYSVLSPPLMALVGVRTLSVLSGLASTWLLAAPLVRTTRNVPTWPALIGALALWANVVSGRATFALGIVSALGTLLVLVGRHTPVWRSSRGSWGPGRPCCSAPWPVCSCSWRARGSCSTGSGREAWP
ncbi:hypothetical protein ACU686_14975 [Yinghuangia aomiensis]